MCLVLVPSRQGSSIERRFSGSNLVIASLLFHPSLKGLVFPFSRTLFTPCFCPESILYQPETQVSLSQNGIYWKAIELHQNPWEDQEAEQEPGDGPGHPELLGHFLRMLPGQGVNVHCFVLCCFSCPLPSLCEAFPHHPRQKWLTHTALPSWTVFLRGQVLGLYIIHNIYST